MSVESQFAICVENDGYAASLELWKVYRMLPDEKAEPHGMIRVVDESGEDYLYSEASFVPITLPAQVADAILAAA
jgi:hypothetical protein